MEFSPLKYLDYDVSQMLCEQVILSYENVARKYHIELYDKYKYKNILGTDQIIIKPGSLDGAPGDKVNQI